MLSVHNGLDLDLNAVIHWQRPTEDDTAGVVRILERSTPVPNGVPATRELYGVDRSAEPINDLERTRPGRVLTDAHVVMGFIHRCAAWPDEAPVVLLGMGQCGHQIFTGIDAGHSNRIASSAPWS